MDDGEKARLIELSNMRLLPYTAVQYLTDLMDRGLQPKVIYDIGACVLHWTNEAVRIWPNSDYYCFEAMPETEFLYHQPHIKGYFNGVLSNREGDTVSFYQNTFHPGGNSYYRENIEVSKEAEIYYSDSHKREYITHTLDNIVREKNFPLPDVIKMDVQGAELDIIKGAPMCVLNAEHLFLELQVVQYNKGAPLRDTVVDYLDSIGFVLVGGGPFTDAGPDGDYHFYNTKKGVL